MKRRRPAYLYFLVLELLVCRSFALTPDGEALLSFKQNLRNSNEVLLQWRENDTTPCSWHGVICDKLTGRVVSLNLPSSKLWGSIASELVKLDQLQRLALHQNTLYGSIPPALGNFSHLKVLLLHDNYLSGQIPPELGRLLELRILDISSNLLSGAIPDSLGNLKNLTNFNVSTNFLTGEIPENGVLGSFGEQSFVGNMGLCGQQVGEICKSQLVDPSANRNGSFSPPKSVPGPPPFGLRKRSSKSSTGFLISALVTVGLSLLIALMCFWGCFLYHKFGKKRKGFEDIEDSGAKLVIFHSDIPYTSKEILRRIELLDESHIIGHGGFGTVYKLVMEDGSAFAVKRIDKSSLSFDCFFERELKVLGSIKHRNLVNLRGYCNSPSAKLLIYDYLQNGTLEEVLHESEDINLTWGARLKVALGAARGIAYLHHDCSPRIIHRDVKSSNILIGENFEPHVSDFGLAKLLEDNISHVTTVIAGTFGYLAPEYLQSGRATEKTDVYSYGIVLLELISGKRPSDASFVEKGLNIVGWAISLKKDRRWREVLDPRCEGVSPESLEALLQIATLCLCPMPDDRPTMHEVVKMLEAEMMSPYPSDFYDSNSD
ncbi:hypothetical protein KP509_10G074200 [Ceratopteris richardii]|uniref:Protein kinase domain-containing protein n=1 Tax=Ceratopteris richardii TaxID=49495 RepID=A0A8T2U0P2_CERRI|nr:hypothetical protein KP509_10G074200 [Ceratopteris richardii]KAH7428069.1 hypothetical protein KP509_10G074200 [Ceratopteris richardii]KAH7428070.1 hypothetical protein KP509_10G074200 [Ceratopteris richardii]KAH7428071.1 hypothetical protein KP509_10G074200 [Ceratopteris richardii]KAH7428072.1 hypothetical protein KP509_10G074200 [Ceratopteris richardii]